MGCGYEIGGLSVEAPCPECGRLIAQTLAVRLGRESPKHLRRFVWGFWMAVVAAGLLLLGTIDAYLEFTRAFQLFTNQPPMRSTKPHAVGGAVLMLAQYLGLVLIMSGARLSLSARRWATLAFGGWTVAHVLFVVALALENLGGALMGRNNDSALLAVGMIEIWSMWVVFIAVPRALARFGEHLNRFVLVTQLRRFVLLTTLWHTIGLLMLLSAWILMAQDVSPRDSAINRAMGVSYLVFAFGSAGWCIYLLVTLARVLSAVKAELRAARGLAMASNVARPVGHHAGATP